MRCHIFPGAAAGMIASIMLAFVASCGTPPREQPMPDAMPGDDAMPACDPAADDDGDCIANGLEGCQETPPADHDDDGGADYLDGDSDDDQRNKTAR